MFALTGLSSSCSEPLYELPSDTSPVRFPDSPTAARQRSSETDAAVALVEAGVQAAAGHSLDAASSPGGAATALDARADASPAPASMLADAAADLCLDEVSVIGGECPGVVHCLGAVLCDRASGELCCTTLLNTECSRRSTCGNAQPAFCDGAEDCTQGSVCCFLGGVAQCAREGSCPEADTLCHRDSDCRTTGCVAGRPDANLGMLFRDRGFCRSTR